ncbi:MAG: selenocysteine-specific elongation factor [Solirubrobacteraceae bacterium]|jgi:selenocysteine-specific elongation factor|nr:selenocysteine-specific elongation factor [Solirubrobacteraceae bacterium]
MSDAPLTLGTAGHIDHGKTALVAALTGVDTDRLPAEKARGISIELGYAPLRLPSGRRLSVVDVPGHERFVRTMVAGATGIDLYLMVVAADDGVMPQTVEHAAVLAALGVRDGVVAVTKADLADPARASEQAVALLAGRGELDVVVCSARTGAGVDAVAEALDRVAGRLRGRAGGDDEPILHVDRAFTIHGAGTVVTGTLWSGSIAPGDRLAVLPAGLRVRVRSVQVHDEPVARAQAGQRVALNLAGIEVRDVARGDVVAAPGAVEPALVLDCELALRDARHGMRAHVHHGTRESAARLADLGDGLWQARLERPLMARAGDRVVVRSIAPPDTLGGGVVLDPAARRHGRRPEALARLDRLRRGEPEPAAPERAAPASVAAPPPAPAPLRPSALALEERLRAAGHEPPAEDELDRDDLRALRAAGRAVRIGRSMYAHPDAVARVRACVEAVIDVEGSITLARLRDELSTSRRFAQALLEHLDAERVTLRRDDDSRVLRRR